MRPSNCNNHFIQWLNDAAASIDDRCFKLWLKIRKSWFIIFPDLYSGDITEKEKDGFSYIEICEQFNKTIAKVLLNESMKHV